MTKVILYIAASLDGCIAGPGGELAWLERFSQPGEDYGYAAFYAGIGQVIMGRKTYEDVLGFGEWPYPGVQTTVISRTLTDEPTRSDVSLYNGDLRALVERLKAQTEKDIWLVGGGSLAGAFLREGLLDELILSLMPVVLGGGAPLFVETGAQDDIALLSSEPFPSGVVQLTYRVG